MPSVALLWREIRIEKVTGVTQCRRRHIWSPSLESHLPKLGRGVNRLREEDLPVALMHSIDFRSFLSLVYDGSDMRALRMCWQEKSALATSYKF